MAGEKLVCFDFDDTLVNAHFHSQLARDPTVQASASVNGIQILQPDGSCYLYNNNKYQGSIYKEGSGAPLSKINELIGIGKGNPPPGLKNPVDIANAIKQAIDNGHKVAITSFTHYPEVAVPTLNAIMQTIMSPQDASRYVNQVCVVGGYPSNGITGLKRDENNNYIPNPEFRGKEEHIQMAMAYFNQQPGVQLTRRDAMLVDDNQPNIDIAQKYGSAQKVPPEHNPSLAQYNYVAPIMTHVGANLRVQNVPVTPPQVQTPTGPQFYEANIIAGELAKLNQQSLTQWETRPGQSNSVSQFVSPPLPKTQAETLLSQLNPNLKAAIYPTRDGSANRVVINIQEAVKNSNALFSKNAQNAIQNQPPSTPLNGFIKEALDAIDLRIANEAVNKRFPQLKDQIVEGLNRINAQATSPQQKEAQALHFLQAHAEKNHYAWNALNSLGKPTSPSQAVPAQQRPVQPVPAAVPVQRQPQPAPVAQQAPRSENFVEQAIAAIEHRFSGENRRLPQLKDITINQLNRINAQAITPQQKEAQALQYLQAQAGNNHYAWNALNFLGKPTSPTQAVPAQQPVQPVPAAVPVQRPSQPTSIQPVAPPIAVQPNIAPPPQATPPIRGPVPIPPAVLNGPTSRPLPQPVQQGPNYAGAPPIVFGSQATKFASHGPTVQPAVPANLPPPPAVQYSQVTNQAPILPPPPIAATNNYVQFSQATKQPPNLPPPVAQSLVQESNMLDNLNKIDISAATLSNQYQQFSQAKHQNHGTLHSFARSLAKSVSGITKERHQQVNALAQALHAIKTDPNLDAQEKAILAYAHLENVKTSMGDRRSGVKDLCDNLKNQIENAVNGTKDYYNMNAYGYQTQARDIIEKVQPTQHKPTR